MVEEEVAVGAVGEDSGTLTETTILSHPEVVAVAGEDLVEVIQTMMMKAVVDLAAPEVVLVVDLNHPMKTEMMTTLGEVSEEGGVDLEGTGVALTQQETTIQDLVAEEVVEVLETEEVDSTQEVIMKTKTLVVALAAREAVEGLEVGVDLVLQMTMMKIQEGLVIEGVVAGALETEEVDLTLWIMITKTRILVALVAAEAVEGLETEEVALVLQTTMTMMMVIPKDSVAEEAVEVLVEAGEDLGPAAMMERRAQTHVVVSGLEEAALVDSNHPTMETRKDLAVVVLVDLEQRTTKTTGNPEVVAEVGVVEVAPAVVTMTTETLTQQNSVLSILNYVLHLIICSCRF